MKFQIAIFLASLFVLQATAVVPSQVAIGSLPSELEWLNQPLSIGTGNAILSDYSPIELQKLVDRGEFLNLFVNEYAAAQPGESKDQKNLPSVYSPAGNIDGKGVADLAYTLYQDDKQSGFVIKSGVSASVLLEADMAGWDSFGTVGGDINNDGAYELIRAKQSDGDVYRLDYEILDGRTRDLMYAAFIEFKLSISFTDFSSYNFEIYARSTSSPYEDGSYFETEVFSRSYRESSSSGVAGLPITTTTTDKTYSAVNLTLLAKDHSEIWQSHLGGEDVTRIAAISLQVDEDEKEEIVSYFIRDPSPSRTSTLGITTDESEDPVATAELVMLDGKTGEVITTKSDPFGPPENSASFSLFSVESAKVEQLIMIERNGEAANLHVLGSNLETIVSKTFQVGNLLGSFGDVDKDGVSELFVMHPGNNGITVLNLNLEELWSINEKISLVGVGIDFTGDNRVELIYYQGDNLTLAAGATGKTIVTKKLPAEASLKFLPDLDGKGEIDLAYSVYNETDKGKLSLTLLRGSDFKTFWTRDLISFDDPETEGMGLSVRVSPDVNGDGKKDLVLFGYAYKRVTESSCNGSSCRTTTYSERLLEFQRIISVVDGSDSTKPPASNEEIKGIENLDETKVAPAAKDLKEAPGFGFGLAFLGIALIAFVRAKYPRV